MGHHRGIVAIVSLSFLLLCGLVDGDQYNECSKVQCTSLEVTPCPADSYRLPSRRVDHNDEDLIQRKCCPEYSVEKCQCIPGLKCSLTNCPKGTTLKVVQNATQEPGKCCPQYECAKKSEEIKYNCNFNGHHYSSGESWAHHKDCTECFCQNGVVSCKPINCDLPTGCPLARNPPNSCCPVCIGCTTPSGIYNNSQHWEEDPCTSCVCTDGRVQCHASMCHTGCSNPVNVPGECCPRCDLNSEVDPHSSCRFLECHDDCPQGFHLDELGCPTCKCLSQSCSNMADCDIHCPFGFLLDENQCSICKCRPHLKSDSKDNSSWVINEHDGLLNSTPKERKNCHSSDGSTRLEGEEWSDHCRRCVCTEGQEMCTLITCTINCEDPQFYSGDCCPRCPDGELGHVNFSISVCQSSDGTERLEGESWGLGPCLKCTCHSGQVLCNAPDCSVPTPCRQPILSQSCCPTCPINEGNSVTTKTNLSCLSDDLVKHYNDGETWKVGPCQSCICESGRIKCFSMGKCPRAQCKRPVLAKNQCCPICLEHGRRSFSFDGRESAEKDLSESTVSSSRGFWEPYCTIFIGVLLGLSLVVGGIVLRHCLCRGTSIRLIKLKKAPPSFHSSNSSQETPPVTPDCCYKCDYNKYSSCSQLSEQKPLFTSSSSGLGNNSDKV